MRLFKTTMVLAFPKKAPSLVTLISFMLFLLVCFFAYLFYVNPSLFGLNSLLEGYAASAMSFVSECSQAYTNLLGASVERKLQFVVVLNAALGILTIGLLLLSLIRPPV